MKKNISFMITNTRIEKEIFYDEITEKKVVFGKELFCLSRMDIDYFIHLRPYKYSSWGIFYVLQFRNVTVHSLCGLHGTPCITRTWGVNKHND